MKMSLKVSNNRAFFTFKHLEKDPYTPAMSIKVYDTRNFNRKSLVGMTTISTLEMMRLQPHQQTADFEAEPGI